MRPRLLATRSAPSDAAGAQPTAAIAIAGSDPRPATERLSIARRVTPRDCPARLGGEASPPNSSAWSVRRKVIAPPVKCRDVRVGIFPPRSKARGTGSTDGTDQRAEPGQALMQTFIVPRRDGATMANAAPDKSVQSVQSVRSVPPAVALDLLTIRGRLGTRRSFDGECGPFQERRQVSRRWGA